MHHAAKKKSRNTRRTPKKNRATHGELLSAAENCCKLQRTISLHVAERA
jgi:hypothetical protein